MAAFLTQFLQPKTAAAGAALQPSQDHLVTAEFPRFAPPFLSHPPRVAPKK